MHVSQALGMLRPHNSVALKVSWSTEPYSKILLERNLLFYNCLFKKLDVIIKYLIILCFKMIIIKIISNFNMFIFKKLYYAVQQFPEVGVIFECC